ncbi:MAG: hypothetical protein HY075_12045 [Deltaproteobacteria bacterium]|nr:hypothetical protein [Deltaproteobacteria bacterium]
MERLPLFIALASLLIWALVAVFMNRKLRTGGRGIGLGLALVQLGCAVWAAARIFGDTSGVSYSGVWFALSPTDVFDVKFVIDPLSSVLWLAMSLFAAVLAYFGLLSQAKGTRSQFRGEAVAVPLLSAGTFSRSTSAGRSSRRSAFSRSASARPTATTARRPRSATISSA